MLLTLIIRFPFEKGPSDIMLVTLNALFGVDIFQS